MSSASKTYTYMHDKDMIHFHRVNYWLEKSSSTHPIEIQNFMQSCILVFLNSIYSNMYQMSALFP